MRVGRVGRPHGLDGAFVVEEGSEDPQLELRSEDRSHGAAVAQPRERARDEGEDVEAHDGRTVAVTP